MSNEEDMGRSESPESDWRHWLSESDLESWFATDTPQYDGERDKAQLEAARRFVAHWLEEDANGFVIPGGDWGRSLMHWLRVMLAATQAEEKSPKPVTAVDERFSETAWRIDFTLDSAFWTEGFERAVEPWLSLYTQNTSWALAQSSAEYSVDVPGSRRQRFTVEITQVLVEEAIVNWTKVRFEDPDNNAEYRRDQLTGTTRFPWFEMTRSALAVDLDEMVNERLHAWDGV